MWKKEKNYKDVAEWWDLNMKVLIADLAKRSMESIEQQQGNPQ